MSSHQSIPGVNGKNILTFGSSSSMISTGSRFFSTPPWDPDYIRDIATIIISLSLVPVTNSRIRMLSTHKLANKQKTKSKNQQQQRIKQTKIEETAHRNSLVLKANSAQIYSKHFFCPLSLTTAKYYFRATKGPLIWLSHMLSSY